jgi:predicted TIM-barrel fold metal-dependent hydrolase
MKEDGLRIDSHVHILPEKRLVGIMRWIKRAFPDHPISLDVTKEHILSDMKSLGITHFFNLAYPLHNEEMASLNAWNIQFCRQTPGAIPFASLHPDTERKEDIAGTLLKEGFIGFKFHPFIQRFDPWDERMYDLYAYLQEVGRPVMFHTGFENFYGMPMPVSRLQDLLELFPSLPMVFVHMTFPELTWVYRMLDAHSNLYLDATNVLAFLRPKYKFWAESMPDADKVREDLLKGLEKYAGRIFHGSDHPAGMGGLAEIYEDLDGLPISPGAREFLRWKAAKSFIEEFVPDFDWNRHL